MKILGITFDTQHARSAIDTGRIVELSATEMELLTSWSRYGAGSSAEIQAAIAPGSEIELRPIFERAQALSEAAKNLAEAAENLKAVTEPTT